LKDEDMEAGLIPIFGGMIGENVQSRKESNETLSSSSPGDEYLFCAQNIGVKVGAL
jgi:hypothetical protein